jgi:flagellar motor protein MotB
MPERADRLVKAVRQWSEAHGVRNVDLANQLGIGPQGVWNILNGTSQVTGEQALALQEPLLKDNLMTSHVFDPTKTRSPVIREFRALQTAVEHIEVQNETISALRSEVARLQGAPTATTKLTSARADSSSSVYPTDGSLSPPGSARLSPAPKKVGVFTVPKKAALPPEADAPVSIQKILDLANLETLKSLCDNPIDTRLQRACIYAELKKRRELCDG